MQDCIEPDCIIHADEKLRTHEERRQQAYQRPPSRKQRRSRTVEPWAAQWLREHQLIDAVSRGEEGDALTHQQSLGNGSGPFEGPGNL
jgi:hypothetical protein